jgi:streptogramin lyase
MNKFDNRNCNGLRSRKADPGGARQTVAKYTLRVRARAKNGVSKSEISRRLRISRTSVNRHVLDIALAINRINCDGVDVCKRGSGNQVDGFEERRIRVDSKNGCNFRAICRFSIAKLVVSALLFAAPAFAADSIEGQVLGGGAPIAKSTVTLWSASADAPKQLAQTQTGDDGRFTLSVEEPAGQNSIQYIVAKGGEPTAHQGSGDNPAIGLIAVMGSKPPAHVVVNEFTTVASVWTNAQFLDGTVLKGNALGLSIAAGNVPNFVDVETGGYGVTIQDAINSTETPTMANFATLANVIAGCVTRVKTDACSSLFVAATGPDGKAPTDTLIAAQSIARNAAYKPERVFGLLDSFYPVPKGKTLRATPYLPYLSFAPSAWVLPLKFTGGGLNAPGKIMFDSEGNAWTGANFIVGSQASDELWDGNMAEFAPNGRPLSPTTTGFHGGGLEGPGFGTAVAADGKVWITSTAGKTISLFDNNGMPLSPPDGYNFNGRLGVMQGIIVTPSGDVWAVDFSKDQIVYLPKGDPGKAKFFCRSPDGKPKNNPCKLNGAFHLAIDQQDRIWITSAVGDTVARFPASDPSKVEVFPTGGHSGKGMAIDSRGNAWITNTMGAGLDLRVKLKLLEMKLTGGMAGFHRVLYDYLHNHPGVGSISMLRPDGRSAPGSPFHGGGAWGSWGVVIDGNDQVWSSNFGSGGSITHLCGARTETCPPGMKTGDPISPPGGYVGGGMQPLTDIAIDPAGNVWVADNWQRPASCFKPSADEAVSTLCGGNGLTVFYGMAKPVRAPQIGPARGF